MANFNFVREGLAKFAQLRGNIDWQMLFNLDKCAAMHFGFANEGMEVRLGVGCAEE